LFFICFYLSDGTFNYLVKVDIIRNVNFDEKIMLFEIYTVFLLIIELNQEPLHSVSVSAVGFWEVSTFCWCVIYLCVLNAWSKRVVLHFWHLSVNKKCFYIYIEVYLLNWASVYVHSDLPNIIHFDEICHTSLLIK